MPTLEIIVLLFCYLQPSFIGLLLFNVSKFGLLNKTLYTSLRSARKKLTSVKFFECAVYSRLIGHVRYDIQILAFAILFIIYDADLIFFLSEALMFESWSGFQFILFFIYAVFFGLGLFYDVKQQQLKWDY